MGPFEQVSVEAGASLKAHADEEDAALGWNRAQMGGTESGFDRGGGVSGRRLGSQNVHNFPSEKYKNKRPLNGKTIHICGLFF